MPKFRKDHSTKFTLLHQVFGKTYTGDISLFPHIRSVTERMSVLPIMEVTIVPLGTASPSVSHYVAEVHKVLEAAPEAIRFQLTPMSTILEGNLDDLFAVVRRMHEVPYSKGAQRVSTSIKIDDRRDKPSTMAGKMQSVQEKLDGAAGPS